VLLMHWNELILCVLIERAVILGVDAAHIHLCVDSIEALLRHKICLNDIWGEMDMYLYKL